MLRANDQPDPHHPSELARVKREGDRQAAYADYARRCMQGREQEADAEAAAVNRRVKVSRLRRSA